MSGPALLVLADGTLFEGISIGAEGEALGEVVFNTSMIGYQEILTDPSYCHQIVTLTYPHIGNYGVNVEDTESRGVFAAGLIIRELSLSSTHFRSEMSLEAYLLAHGTVGIAGIDTRKLTRLLREKGAQAGCIMAGSRIDQQVALEKAQGLGSLSGQDLAKVVSCKQPYEWDRREWVLGVGYAVQSHPRFKVVAYDFGLKHNILRMLSERGCHLTVVPAQTRASEVLAMNPDGIFLSNGPGDPEACDYAITATREFVARGIPLLGICLGHQLLGLAVGAKTSKMKFGHHGANHPVQDLETRRVMITSQNHGFHIDEASLPSSVRITHRSLFDGTIQGIELVDRPAFGFQGHPEASPGPHDLASLFDRFVEMIAEHKKMGSM